MVEPGRAPLRPPPGSPDLATIRAEFEVPEVFPPEVLAYAHVTAPLRRLVDRFGTEVCLALAADTDPAPELRAALPELPALMAASGRRTREVERAVLDATEAWALRGREGQRFSAVVLDEEGRGTVVLDGHAVRGRCSGEGLRPGTRVQVRSEEADVAARTVRFALDGVR